MNLARTLCLAALFVLVASAPGLGGDSGWQGLPDDVRAGYAELVDAASELEYLPRARYDALRAEVRQARTLDETRGLLRDLTQLTFDHDTGDAWLLRLADELEREDMEPLGAAAWPRDVELTKITLRDGLTLVGTGGPLTRHYENFTAAQLAGQWYFEPNIGAAGLGNWNITADDLARTERVRVAVPQRILVSPIADELGDDGRLAVTGDWLTPGRGVQTSVVYLTPRIITAGGTLFVSEEFGVQCVLPTHVYPGLAAAQNAPPDLAREVGWDRPDPAQADDEALDAIHELIDDLRERAPDAEWPLPFDPDPTHARFALGSDEFVDDDPAASLRRLRLALTYGADLPDAARADPAAFLALEDRVRSVLRGGLPVSSLAGQSDWRVVAATLRHAPDFDAPPAPGIVDGTHLQFPPGYCGWKTYPLLVVLHGQYSRPDYDFDVWREAAAEAGMILVCPQFGSTSGAPRTREDDEKVLAVIRRLSLCHNVDPDRVYLTGISMGGAKTWSLASCHTDRWAAAAPEIHGPIWRVASRGGRVSFPLLPNLAGLPLHVMEGRFDGLNTANSRAAVTALLELKASLVYHEAGLIGHERMAWRYPVLLDWFAEQRRASAPATLDFRAMNAHRAERAWLRITKVSGGTGWSNEDGGFSPSDLTGVRATASAGKVEIHATVGKPREVELQWDPALMGPGPVDVSVGGKPRKWTPRPDIAQMVETVLRTGDRARLYPDSIRVSLAKH